MAFGNYSNHSYTGRRLILYALLWITAAVELGLTAWRIHFTRSNFGVYGKRDGVSSCGDQVAIADDPFSERIIAELLFASILTVIWVPIACVYLDECLLILTRR